MLIFCGINQAKSSEKLLPEFIKLKNNKWKDIYILMNKVKNVWRMHHFNTELTLEFQNLSKEIFDKLKSSKENIALRKKNYLLENELNTEFQILLFDFLYEEKEMYDKYGEIFEQKNYGINIGENKKSLFDSFIKNYKKYFIEIYNDERKIKRLKKLRWYILFDEDNLTENFLSLSNTILFNVNVFNNLNDSFNEKEKEIIYNKFLSNDETLEIKTDIEENQEFIISEKIIDSLLNNEENPILYLIKLISLTLIIFCKESMCYLNSTYDEKNSGQIIKEYIKRFNNYIQAIKYINDQCRNLNIVMNYLDKDINKTYPHFPKFSIFRLGLKVWYSQMSLILTEDNNSLFTKIKKSLINLFQENINDDLFTNFNNSKNNSFQSFLFNSGNSSNLTFSSSSKNFNLSTSISLFNSNNQTFANTVSPFGSFYEDNFAKFFLVEKGLGIFLETFSDEYSVYLFNLSNLETNNYYDDIEENFLEIIKNSIKKLFKEKIVDNVDSNKESNDVEIIRKFKDKIINYFSSNFFTKKIINKFKQKIYLNIADILKQIIFEYIANKVNIYQENKNRININTNIQIEQKYILELKKYLPNDFNLEEKICEIESLENIFEIISDIDKWIIKEMQNFKSVDKKILKELNKNNIPSENNILQKYLLSYSVKNDWNVIRKIRTIENYFKKINEKKKNNQINNNSNSNSFQNDLNDDNENMNFFGNQDIEIEINNNKDNNIELRAINELKGSHIFY